MAQNTPDTITLLRPHSGGAAKRITRSGVQPAPAAVWHTGGSVPLASFDALRDTLQALHSDPAWYVVRGTLRDGVDASRFRRTHVGEGASLLPCAHRWLLLDLDRYLPDTAPGDFASAPAHYAARARSELPACFRAAACCWQATGSAGVKPGVRLRLAFWLSRALADVEIKAWSETWQVPVDASLYTPSQPHYTAAPIVAAGCVDPVPGARFGVLDGEDTVPLPAQLLPRDSFAAEDALRAAAARVKRAEDGERRNTLNRCAFALASKHGGDLTDDQIKAALLAAASTTQLPGHEAEQTLRDALRDGRARAARATEGWRAQLALDPKTSEIRSTQANVSLYVEHHDVFRGRLAYDERALSPMWVEQPPWGSDPAPRPVVESDDTYAVEWFQAQVRLDAKPAWVRAALLKAARLQTYDPIQDYLGKLPAWDGAPRADTFFARHLGVEDTPLTRAQSRAWFVQAARRAYATLDAPVQADYLIVLSGPTGFRKSSVLRALCPLTRFFRDDLPEIHTKDARQAVADAWIVELAELTHRKADRDAFKAFITARVDKFRPPYGRDELTVPRRCVLAGTTNEVEFLTDPTGNRRFWPMICMRQADPEAVAAERDQVWAEALHLARTDAPAYLPPDMEAQAAEIQEAHREEDLAETALHEALVRPSSGTPLEAVSWEPGQLDAQRRVRMVTATQACTLAGLDPRQASHASRVKAALRRLGWAEKRKDAHGVRKRYWTPPDSWAYEVVEERAN